MLTITGDEGAITVQDGANGDRSIVIRDTSDQMAIGFGLNADQAREVSQALLPHPDDFRRVSITNDMVNALGGAYTLDTVRKVRKLLRFAGIEAELHPLEVERARQLREQAKASLLEADRIDGGQ